MTKVKRIVITAGEPAGIDRFGISAFSMNGLIN